MKVTYETDFNFGMPTGTVNAELPLPNATFHFSGSIDCTEKEYITCLEATVKAAKEAAEVWRPIAADLVKSVFAPASFKEFCAALWTSAKHAIGG